jgi:hypothetical protein
MTSTTALSREVEISEALWIAAEAEPQRRILLEHRFGERPEGPGGAAQDWEWPGARRAPF